MMKHIPYTLLCTLMVITPLQSADNTEYLYGEELNDENIFNQPSSKETFQVIIEPIKKTELSTEIQSPVLKIYKRLGESFKKDEPLILLEQDVFLHNLKKNQSLLEKAEVELEGKKQLFQDNVVSLFELKEAEANVASAKSDLAFAEKNMEATTMHAPYDGKVVNLQIEEYELPQKGQQLIEIINDKTLVAKLLVPSTMLSHISIGMPFTIALPEADEKVEAKISRIGAVIDPSSSTIQIEADIDNKEGKLWAGMTGIADFNLEKSAKENQ